jgi:hypothetical protein
MRFHPAYGLVLLAALVAACGPMPVDRAEDACLRDAQLASHPRGEIALGSTSEGPRSRVKLEVSSDFIQGRDPSEVYNSCVYNRSGQLPTRPLYSRTDWKG